MCWLQYMKRSLDCILVQNYLLKLRREFSNFVDYYTVAVKNDSIDDVPSIFKNSFRSDHVAT